MADKKITQLTAETAPVGTDLIEMVDDPGGTPASRKVTFANVTKALDVVVGDAGSGGTKGLVPAPAAGDAAAGKFLKADGTFATPSGGTPGAHASSHQSGGGDAIKLDDLAAPDDNTDLNASTTAHGLLPKLNNSATQFLNGQGAWATPAGAGDVVGPASAVDNALARFDSTTGKLIQSSVLTLDDDGGLTFPEIAAPTTPAAGKVVVYAKSDGKMYRKDDAGAEAELGGGGGSIAPLEIVDANTVRQINGANAQEFRVHENATDFLYIKTVSGVHHIGSSTSDTYLVTGSLQYRFGGGALTSSGNPDLGSSSGRWGTLYSNALNMGNGGTLQWNTNTRLVDTAAGWLTLRAVSASTAEVKLSFGENSGTSAPMLKRASSSAVLEVKQAGDADFTHLISGSFRAAERSADPAASDLTSGSNVKDRVQLYMKNDKFVIAYNNGGTVTYITIPLDGSTATWTHSTSAP